MNNLAPSPENRTHPPGGRIRPTPAGQPTIAPAQRRTVAELLGLLAGEGEDSSDGERDIVASALCRALDTSTTNEFPSLAATLDGHRDELSRRARRCQRSDLELQGLFQEAPLLALCAEIHRSGLVEADGKQARSKLFLALADLAAYEPELAKASYFRSAAAGLRLLIQRLAQAPKAGVATHHFSVWELINWIDAHPDLADYVKQAAKSLRPRLVLAWSAPPPRNGEVATENEEEEGATPEESTPNEIIWAVPESGLYECDIPPSLKKTLLANELTRVTALSRYASASLLNYSDAQMRAEVSRLTEKLHRDPVDAPHLLAQLLSIATGTPVADVYRILCRAPDDDDPAPSYPGVLTDDARWLIRAEFDPRSQTGENFCPRAVHVPIPESVAMLLLAQPGGLHPGMPVIATLSGAKRPPTPRVASSWFTALASRLMREGRFGVSLSQHALHTSLGLDTPPLFYDRIPANHLAHVMAMITHPWFGCPPRPSVKGLPSHYIGSQRVVARTDCKAFLQGLRAGWSNTLPLPERIHLRSRNLRYGVLLGTAHRTNESIAGITRATIAAGSLLITIGDKAVALDYPTRLAALGTKLVRELQDLLAELALAVDEFPDTALAQAAKRILAGSQSIFLHVDSVDACHSVDLERHLADAPPWSEGIPNWMRQLANDELNSLVVEPLRVAQTGWHGTRAGAISELSVLSPLQVCSRLSRAVDDLLKACGWAPLPTSGLPPVTASLPPVHWVEAGRAHRREFEQGLARLERAAEAEREAFASSVLPGVNAFLVARNIPLEATTSDLIRRGASEPMAVGRDLHAALLKAMVADTKATVLAREVLYSWLEGARRDKVVKGCLPRRIVRTRPCQPGIFPQPAHRSIEHRDSLLEVAHQADLSAAARTFLTILLEGWVADAGTVLRLLRPNARLHDLRDRDILLIEASRCRDSDSGESELGCHAFDGPAAIALRAWHRGGQRSTPDAVALRQEIHRVLAHVLSERVSAEEVFDELEALMRVNLSLRAPGIVRDVVSRRVVPSYAPLDRVVALHENDPICPREPTLVPAACIAAGLRKSRASRAHQGYNRVKDILSNLTNRWTPGNDDETRAEAIVALRNLVPGGVPSTGDHIVALYAAAYLTEGLQKARVRPITVQDVVYSVGHALLEALPEQADLSRREVWEATYARALSACNEEHRLRLAEDLNHFQKVMAREFNLPVVGLAPLLVALDMPSPPEPVGFLTEAEQSALVCFGRLRMEAATANGAPSEHEEALRALAVATCGLSTSLRDREVRLPQVKSWRTRDGEHPVLALGSNGQDFVKSEASRRSLIFSGRFRPLAIEAIEQLAGLNRFRNEPTCRKLLVASSVDIANADASSPTAQINADLRYVTGCSLAAFDITRKSWALRNFGAIGVDHPSLWPTRDYLSAMGQAGIATTLGHYLHDPLTFLERMPKSRHLAIADAGWILGMVPRAAMQLLRQNQSWLRPRAARQPRLDANVTMLPSIPAFSSFAPSVVDAGALLGLLAEGQSVEAALRALAWPSRLAAQIKAVREELRPHRVEIASQSSVGMFALAPPARKHGHEALERCAVDARCRDGLAWIFRTWLIDRGTRSRKGFSAAREDWATHVPESSPLQGLPWSEKPDDHLTLYELPGDRTHSHSAWPELHWLALAAWLISRLRVDVSTYQGPGRHDK